MLVRPFPEIISAANILQITLKTSNAINNKNRLTVSVETTMEMKRLTSTANNGT
jgi:hypothetical protein